MTKNYFVNALAAVVYIVLVVSIMHYGTRLASGGDDTIIIPIAMISIFTLSAAMMGYIFLCQPILLCLDGKKKEAVDLFLKTVVVFAGITILALFAAFSGLL